MKILIIRHGDPDYEKDRLTPKGKVEALALAGWLSGMRIDAAYVSPLGRARETAAPTLEKIGMEATVCGWLREFDERQIWRPDDTTRRRIPWDWLPADWTADERFYREDQWYLNERMAEAGIGENYRYVIRQFDDLLAGHGYVREGRYYRVTQANEKVLALFCHYGLGCVLLSHTMGVSPMTLWHGICMAPSSVTTLVTEERREGIASLRATGIGDISHLAVAGQQPSAAARFCECWKNQEERHD